MKITSITFTGRGKVEITERALPEKLKPTQILIKSACSMVSAGTELAALTGTHSKSGLPNAPAWLRFPSVPGYLVCGEVIDKGSSVTNFKIGDRLVGEGPGVWNSHCSHIVMEANDYKAIPIAKNVSFEEAVTIKMGSIAMTGPRLLHLQLGDTVAVFGLGMVGQLTSQLCVVAGAGKVIAVDPLAKRRGIASQFKGITAVEPDDDLLAPVGSGDRLSGFDHAIEASGNPAAFLKACEIVRMRGKIAVLSSPHRTMEIRLYDQIHSRGLQVFGAHGSVLTAAVDVNDRWTDGRQRRFFMQLLSEKRVDILPLFTHKVAYTKAPEMYKGLMENPRDYLGILFYWNDYVNMKGE